MGKQIKAAIRKFPALYELFRRSRRYIVEITGPKTPETYAALKKLRESYRLPAADPSLLKTRVSIHNCVSNALDMLQLSSETLIENAGTDNFDYIVVTWNSNQDVLCYLNNLKKKYEPRGIGVHISTYQTNPRIGFIPNLRAMINQGFEEGFRLNEYAGLVNTDQAFAPGWLEQLIIFMGEDRVISSITVDAGVFYGGIGPIRTRNFGRPTKSEFQYQSFVDYAKRISKPNKVSRCNRLITGFPYLFHRKWWNKCGPWELHQIPGFASPDVRFFTKLFALGVRNLWANGSVCYHWGAAERLEYSRHSEAKQMPEE